MIRSTEFCTSTDTPGPFSFFRTEAMCFLGPGKPKIFVGGARGVRETVLPYCVLLYPEC